MTIVSLRYWKLFRLLRHRHEDYDTPVFVRLGEPAYAGMATPRKEKRRKELQVDKYHRQSLALC